MPRPDIPIAPAPVHRRLLAVAVIVVGLLGSSACSSSEADEPSTTAGRGATTTTAALAGARRSAGCDRREASTSSETVEPVERTVDVDGTRRTFLLGTAGTEPDVPAPLVVLLHGMGSSAADIDRVSGLPARAAEVGAIVLTPQALGSPTMWTPSAQSPDASFISQAIGEVADERCVDTSRVQVVGFSVGAVLAAAYACAHQDQVASIVTVTVELPAGCTRPMPILAFHGTADPVVPYGNFDPAAGPVTGAEANMAKWAASGGCDPTPMVDEIGNEVTQLDWSGCDRGVDVTLYRIIGGGHAWPGADADVAQMSGTQQISATDEALDFSRRHQLRP